jgi:hypothetical protein
MDWIYQRWMARFFIFSILASSHGHAPAPAIDIHPWRRDNIQKTGLTGKYEPLVAGAESQALIPTLAKIGLIKSDGGNSNGNFDAIIYIRVLCGVHHQEEVCEQLFQLLKSGCRMIVCGHVTVTWPDSGTPLGYSMQSVYWLLGWNFWMSGCTINRDTVRTLRKTGTQAR